MTITVRYNSIISKDYIFNSFQEIPNYDDICYIHCSNNHLTTLPRLPQNLTHLNCSFNQLATLPELPKRLRYLKCQHNSLTHLDKLPNSIEVLSCYDNQFISQSENKILNNTLDNMIYSVTPDREIFITNLFQELGKQCLECQQEFLCLEEYRPLELEQYGKYHDITIKNNYCQNCLVSSFKNLVAINY